MVAQPSLAPVTVPGAGAGTGAGGIGEGPAAGGVFVAAGGEEG